MNIIVTGAGKGLGYETTMDLAIAGGNKIIAVSRDLSKWEKSPHACVIPFQLDLEDKDAHAEFGNFVKKNFAEVDILINNAGQIVNKPFAEQTPEDFDRQFNVNVKSVFLFIQTLLPLFKKGSHVVNISSMGGFQGSLKYPGLALYSASKAAVASLTECLAAEFSDTGICFNCLALGAAQTEMLATAFPGYKAPLTAKEMAGFIAWFAMNGHRFFNGKILPVASVNP